MYLGRDRADAGSSDLVTGHYQPMMGYRVYLHISSNMRRNIDKSLPVTESLLHYVTWRTYQPIA